MPLLLLVTALVVLGVVAVLAAGRWDGLVPTSGAQAADRAPSPLPPGDRAIRAEDLATLRFAVAFRGYRADQVEALLDRLAVEIAARDERIAALEGRTGPTGAASPAAGPDEA